MRAFAAALLLLLLLVAVRGAMALRGPDLTLVSVEASRVQLRPGRVYSLNVTVVNRGDAESGGFEVLVKVDGQPLSSITLPGLKPGEERRVSFTFTVWGRVSRLSVIVDPYDRVREVDEGNNVYVVCFRRLPDLEAGFRAVPEALRSGSWATLPVYVVNRGSVEACSFKVRLMVNGTVVAERVVEAVKPMRHVDLALAWRVDLPGGVARLTLIVDPDDLVEELDEYNNVAVAYSRVVAPAPPIWAQPWLAQALYAFMAGSTLIGVGVSIAWLAARSRVFPRLARGLRVAATHIRGGAARFKAGLYRLWMRVPRIEIHVEEEAKRWVKENLGAPFIFLFMALLVLAAGELAMGREYVANELAVYAYYALVAGVILQLVSYLKYQRGGEEE